MSAHEIAVNAFNNCRSKSHEKNVSCSRYLAVEAMKQRSIPASEIELLKPAVFDLLDQWWAQRQADPNYMPVVETGNLSTDSILET